MAGWGKDDEQRLAELLGEGKQVDEIAQIMGKTSDSVRSKCRRIPKPVPVEAMRSMDESSLRSQVERLTRQIADMQAKQSPKRVPVETAAEAPTDAATLWARAEEDSAKRIAYAHERSRFKVSFDEARPIAIAFVSDQHIAPGTPVDFKRMREDAELIQATDGLYACLAGDGVDNHIKHRVAILAARSQPQEQWQLFEWYLQIFAEKVIAMCSGNHDAWSDQIAGIDMVAQIAQRNRLCYCPAEARISVEVGGHEYKVAIRHQYRMNSSFNMGHAVKQWYRMGEEPFDIGVLAHNHEPSVESFEAHSLTRWAFRPGAYQITSSFTRQFGWNETNATSPTAILFPGQRRIIGFRDVRDAVKTLAAERR